MKEEYLCKNTELLHMIGDYYYLPGNGSVYFKQKGLNYLFVQELSCKLKVKCTNKEFSHYKIIDIEGKEKWNEKMIMKLLLKQLKNNY